MTKELMRLHRQNRKPTKPTVKPLKRVHKSSHWILANAERNLYATSDFSTGYVLHAKLFNTDESAQQWRDHLQDGDIRIYARAFTPIIAHFTIELVEPK